MKSVVEILRKGIIDDATSADARQVFSMAMALCEPPLVELPAAVEAHSVAPRFVVRRHEVRDNVTGLIWTRENVPGGRLNWEQAKAAAAGFQLDGHTWRLPTIKELLTLVDYDRHEPAIDPSFACESAWYWSSTPAAVSPGVYAWGVYFGGGNAFWSSQSSLGFVRAVRVGQF